MSNLFETTHNPDVLSCIANLSNDEVFTPPELVNQMLDMLPEELWSDPNATFLDPACKSGVFLREIAKRLIKGLADEIPDLEERLEHIYKKQLYGIACTELTSLLSRRSLYCSKWPNSVYSVVKFDDPKGNIDYLRLEHSWEGGRCRFCGAAQREYDRDESLEQYAYEFIHLDNPEEVLPMKFDVIIGNPPYQMSDGGQGASASPIYHYFVEQAVRLNPRFLVMIIPARWYAGGKGLDGFRERMISDTRMRELHDFPNAGECFGNGIEIKGGVCYFLWDRDRSGKCRISTHSGNEVVSIADRYMKIGEDNTFIRRNESITILEKTRAETSGSFADLVSSRKPFGFPTNYEGRRDSKGDCRLLMRGGYGAALAGDVKKNKDWIPCYKVFITKAYGASETFPHQIINKPVMGFPGDCCTETYIVVGPFEDQSVTANVISYMSTKLFRFLVSLKKISQDATQRVYEFVPMQDFSKPWTDEELYAKYGLTDEEIAFIESMIRPMDLGGDSDE